MPDWAGTSGVRPWALSCAALRGISLTITASPAAKTNCKFGSDMFGSVFTQHTVTMNASPPKSARSVCERTRFKPKPDVQGFLRLVRANHLRARRCIMVEDTLANLRTAKKLGMKTVWVSRERRAPRYVDLRIANLSELRRALPQLS